MSLSRALALFSPVRDATPEGWHVVFGRSLGGRAWWHRFADPEFQHVLAFREIAPGMVWGVNPRMTDLEVVTERGSAADWVQAFARDHRRVVFVKQKRFDYALPRRSIGIWTCATCIGYLLGIPRRFVWPEALYQHLLVDEGAALVGVPRERLREPVHDRAAPGDEPFR